MISDEDLARERELRDELEKFNEEWKIALRRGDLQSAQIYQGTLQVTYIALVHHVLTMLSKRLAAVEGRVADVYAMVDALQSKDT